MKYVVVLIVAAALAAAPAAAQTDYVASGWDYLNQGNFERAERMFKGALKIDVDDEAAWKGLRELYMRMGQRKGGPAPSAAPARPAPPPSRASGTEAGTSAYAFDEPARPAPSGPAGWEEPPRSQQSPFDLGGPASPQGPPPSSTAVEEINRELLSKYLPGARPPSEEDEESGSSREAASSGKERRPPREAAESAPRQHSAGSRQGRQEERIDDTINKELLDDEGDAREAFERLRRFATTPWRREHDGAVQFLPTFYSQGLYKLLVTRLGAQKNWSIEEAKKRFLRLVENNKGLLEFYVKMVNYTRSPKKAVAVHDIMERTFLEDDQGNSYKPVRFKAPSVTKLLEEDSYTIWFPKYDAQGNSIVEKAKERLFLVINDQDGEPATIRIPFKKEQLGDKPSSGGDDKSWWQKLF